MGVTKKTSDDVIELIQAMAKDGVSVRKIAAFAEVNRQTVLKYGVGLFRKLERNPFVEFNGKIYHKLKDGWWRCGNRKLGKTYLHRDTYVFYKGPIPDGHDVNHIDHNKDNNDPTNLEALVKPEHGREGARWRRKNKAQANAEGLLPPNVEPEELMAEPQT